METVGGQGNLLLSVRRTGGGVELTRVETADREVVLPETVWGLPVTALGRHAFAPGDREAEGERVRVACGPEAAFTPDNGAIRRITLPDSLVSVGDYAFYNCAALRELRLTDRARLWGGGALMNCRELNTFHIRLHDERAEVLSYFADELPRELDATLVYPGGETARLLFPEYVEAYEENTPAKHFDYHIYGAGYPYHHCFWKRALQLKEYDALWRTFLGMEHDPLCALRLAWYRLRHPYRLGERAAGAYLAYLRERAADVADWLLEKRDAGGLGWFLSRARPDRETLAAAAERARRLGLAEAVALLLEEQHRRGPGAAEKTFDL